LREENTIDADEVFPAVTAMTATGGGSSL